MATEFIPSREAELVTWTTNFASLLVATPTVFGISAGQASSYQTLSNAFIAAYNVAQSDSTRTPAVVSTKNVAKAAMIASARSLARIIQSFPGLTNAQRLSLGLTVHTMPAPIPAPNLPPALEIGTVSGYTVKIKLHDSASGSKRGKPPGVSGASVFSFAGAAPPTDISAWKFEGNTSRTSVAVVFANTLAAGAQVWLSAFWFSPRKVSGPACAPVGTNLQGGGVSMAA